MRTVAIKSKAVGMKSMSACASSLWRLMPSCSEATSECVLIAGRQARPAAGASPACCARSGSDASAAAAVAAALLRPRCSKTNANGKQKLMPVNMTVVMAHGFSKRFTPPALPTPSNSYTVVAGGVGGSVGLVGGRCQGCMDPTRAAYTAPLPSPIGGPMP